jgi:cytochrome P450
VPAGHPDAAAQLRSDRTLIPAALEEVLRVRSPITQAHRISTVDVTIAGHTIPAGSFVAALLLSANNDQQQFADPDLFDIHRAPNKHLGFGHGIHFCLGAPLARLETSIALNQLFDQFADLQLSGQPVFHDTMFYGAQKLAMTAQRH